MEISENYRIAYPWLTEKLFSEQLFQKYYGKNTKVINVLISATGGNGENYCSQIFSVTVKFLTLNGNEERKKFLVKTTLLNNETQRILEKYNLFIREKAAYEIVLPKVHQLLESVGDKSKFSARIYSSSSKPDYLIFDDLSVYGYKNVLRTSGLNYEHLKFSIKLLAKWHATTAVLGEMDISIMKDHRYQNVSKEIKYFHETFRQTLHKMTDVAEKWNDNFGKIISKKLRKLSCEIIEKSCEIFTSNDEDFNVLTHGDCWMNNIMFKYHENGDLQDAILVDYACGFWGSPVIDIAYLLFSSSSEEVHEIEWDHLIFDYHQELLKILKMLKYPKKIPTLRDLQIEMLMKGIFSITSSLYVLPLRLIPAKSDDNNSSNISLENLIGNSEDGHEFRTEIFGNEKYQTMLKYYLEYFHRKGYFE